MSGTLLIGKDGQLGQELQPLLESRGEVVSVGRQTLDLTNPEQIRQIIRQVQPRAIVNAAAYTAVDKAESEPAIADAINGMAPQTIAEEAQKLNAALIQVSTDYVFDGRKNTPYLESDPTNPLGAYGWSKLKGEAAVQQHCDRHVILRTAWVYGVGGKGNFVKTMLRLGAEREELRVVVDQVGTPTWTGDLAKAIGQFLEKMTPENSDPVLDSGIYHFANSGAISWYDFAIAIFEEAEQLGFPLKIQQVIPITTAEYPTPAARPAYSVLSQVKTAAVLGASAPHWRQGLRHMLCEFQVKTAQT